MRVSRLFGDASPLRALAHPSFAYLWTGQVISQVGNSLQAITLAWWVLEETGSAAVMGAVLIAAEVPYLLFLLIGGVMVDRFPRMYVMLASDVLCGLAMGLVAVLAALGALALWHLFILSALFGVVGAFFSPAFTATIPDIVPAPALTSANSLRSLGAQVGSVAGPALGGVVVATGGTTLAFALDAVSFFASAICVAGAARLPSLQRTMAASSGLVRDLGEGIGTVLRQPWLWVTIGIAGASNLTLVGPIATSLPMLVDDRYGGRVGAYALLQSSAAAGAIIAAVGIGRFGTMRRRGWLVYGAWLVDAAMLLSLGFPVPLVIAASAMFVFGAAETMLGLVWMTTLQDERIVSSDRLGRVASIDEFGSAAMVPIGYAVAGVATDRMGPSIVFVVGGALGMAIIALALLHPAVRNLD